MGDPEDDGRRVKGMDQEQLGSPGVMRDALVRPKTDVEVICTEEDTAASSPGPKNPLLTELLTRTSFGLNTAEI